MNHLAAYGHHQGAGGGALNTSKTLVHQNANTSKNMLMDNQDYIDEGAEQQAAYPGHQ